MCYTDTEAVSVLCYLVLVNKVDFFKQKKNLIFDTLKLCHARVHFGLSVRCLMFFSKNV